jgi:hypothetical protein
MVLSDLHIQYNVILYYLYINIIARRFLIQNSSIQLVLIFKKTMSETMSETLAVPPPGKIKKISRAAQIRRDDGFYLSTARLARSINNEDLSSHVAKTGVLAIAAATELLFTKLLDIIIESHPIPHTITAQDIREAIDSDLELQSALPCIVPGTHPRPYVTLDTMGRATRKKIMSRLLNASLPPSRILKKIKFH